MESHRILAGLKRRPTRAIPVAWPLGHGMCHGIPQDFAGLKHPPTRGIHSIFAGLKHPPTRGIHLIFAGLKRPPTRGIPCSMAFRPWNVPWNPTGFCGVETPAYKRHPFDSCGVKTPAYKRHSFDFRGAKAPAYKGHSCSMAFRPWNPT